jgi:nitronate monooxygenase/enoyl-[acyl-carrier protein] reductase II
MLRTPLCDLLGLDAPLLCAPFGPWDEVDLAIAVCEAGALGQLGTALRSVDELEAQWAAVRARTDRPFAVNHTNRPFSEESFAATLRARPKAISFHLAVPEDLIARAHDAGILWIQQVTDRAQARAAVAAGADVLVAQGGEAGGHAGEVATMVIVPQVVDVAGGVPVVAAGGIADGRGVAAALALGAQGAMLGTRFLASEEMGIDAAWKARIVDAEAEEAVKVVGSDRVLPPFTRPGAHAVPRALRTPLTDQLAADPAAVDPDEVVPRFVAAARAGGGHEDLPMAGQSAGLVVDVRPAAQIVADVLAEAQAALAAAHGLAS